MNNINNDVPDVPEKIQHKENPCTMFDITQKCADQDYNIDKNDFYILEKNNICKILKQYFKDGFIQLEKSEKDENKVDFKNKPYIHFQIRGSSIKKIRLGQLINTLHAHEELKNCHISVSCNKTFKKNDMSYVTKGYTKLLGPWKLTDEPIFIQRRLIGIKLLPWQNTIVGWTKNYDERHINIILDIYGNNGKSTLCMYLETNNLATDIGFCNDFDTIIRRVHCMDKSPCYFIDMPRAIKKDKLQNMYSALETIKQGKSWDDRYHYSKSYFEQPVIIVFTNTIPDLNFMSRDRWYIWYIDENKELVKYNITYPKCENFNFKNKENITCSDGTILESSKNKILPLPEEKNIFNEKNDNIKIKRNVNNHTPKKSKKFKHLSDFEIADLLKS